MNQGADRIEFSPVVGRPIRQGSFAELSVSDRERVLQAIEARDLECLTAYWDYLAGGQQFMMLLAYEWVLRWIKEVDPDVRTQGHQVFMASLSDSEEAIGCLVEGLLAENEDLSVLADPSTSLLAPHLPQARLDEARKGDWDTARFLFEATFQRAKTWHDLLFRYSYAVMSALLEKVGPEQAPISVQKVLTSLSFYEPSWQQAATVEPEQLAVMLSEHLRLHFSGPDGGGVEIIDEPDRIRLVLSPCGSGGAMRRQVGDKPGFARLEQASEVTWGRTGVPLYCSHCAMNELESVKRFGHRKWITEFDPDPNKPCGWTILKNPEHAARNLAE